MTAKFVGIGNLVGFGGCVLIAFASSLIGAPSAPSISIPSQPPNLGGAGSFPVKDIDPSSPSTPSSGPGLKVSGSVREGFLLEWSPLAIPITSYVIERRVVSSGWAAIASLDATARSYRDTSVKTGRRYHYRVVPMVSVTPQAILGPESRLEGISGTLEDRGRAGTATLHGFANYLPEEFSSLFGLVTQKEDATYFYNLTDSAYGYSISESGACNTSSDHVMSIDDGQVTITFTGSAFYYEKHGEAPATTHNYTLSPSGTWSGDNTGYPEWPGEIDGNDLRETETTQTWHTSRPSSGGFEGVSWEESKNSTRTYTLSEPITDDVALDKAKQNRGEFSGWGNAENGLVGPSSLTYSDLSYWLPGYAAQINATVTDAEYRFKFDQEPSSGSAEVTMQMISMPLDDPRTKEVNEAEGETKFSYQDVSISAGAEGAYYVTSPRSCPAGEMEPFYEYMACAVSATISVSDYRGLADNDEKKAGSGLVGDHYQGLAIYYPEVVGPTIYVDPNHTEFSGGADVSARFSGGVDGGEWTGQLSWSGPVEVTRPKGNNSREVVGSPVRLGYQEDTGEYISGADLHVRSLNGSEGTVTFELRVKDSKGTVAVQDTANIHLVAIPERVPTGSERPDFYTVPVNDATGPAYRKISVYGRPIPDAPPQATPETDAAKEETYVDAFSLNLRHSTTDIYVSVPGSDLALTVRRNLSPEIWNFFSGLRPHERPDRPFGSGWSSNIGASIEFMTPTGPDEDGYVAPPEAIVTDDDGNQHRFFVWRDGYFFPYPSAPHEAKAYLTTLAINQDGKYVFSQKHGKALTFERISGYALTIANDRVNGSGSGVSYSYARLLKVSDRLGYSLNYSFGGATTLIPNVIEARRPDDVAIPGHRIYIRQNDVTRCITSVWDPSGNETVFNYGTSEFINPKNSLAGPQSIHYLKKVSSPATSSVEYAYESDDPAYPFVVEADPIPRREQKDRVDTYQLNVSAIAQKVGASVVKYGFLYETDTTREILIKVPGFSGYRVQAGAPRRIREISLPIVGRNVQFSSIGRVRVVGDGETPKLEGKRGSAVIDAEGSRTVYRFEGISIISLKKFKDLFQPEEEGRKPKIVYYTDMIIDSPYGSETYSFDIRAGLSLSKIVDFSGNKTTYEYNNTFTPSSNVFSQILPQGFFRYNDPNVVKKEGLNAQTFTYSGPYRLLTEATDERSNRAKYEFDDWRRISEKHFKSGSATPTQQTDFAYGSADWPGFVTKQTVKALTDDVAAAVQDLVTDFVPDSAGRIESKTTRPSSGVSLTTYYFYNWNNAKVFTNEPGGTVASPFPIRTLFTYDGRQRLKKVTFEDDSYKELSYDGRGRKVAERDENGNITSFGYDAGDRLLSKIRRVPGDKDIVESFRYNRVGSVTDSVNPRGFTTIRAYDEIQRIISVDEPGKGITQFVYGKNSGSSVQNSSAFQPTTVIDARGYITTNVYDSYYRLSSSERSYGGGSQLTRFKYDGVGNKTHVYDAFGNLTETKYDELNRPVEVINDLGNSEKMYYTSTGLLWKKLDLRGQNTITRYDGAGRATSVIAPEIGGVFPTRSMEYDRAGNLSKLIDEREKSIAYSYDVRNRLTLETKPLVYDAESGQMKAPVTRKGYDYVGNVVDTWDARDVRTHMVYDVANRLVESHSAYQTPLQASMFSFYDQGGNVTKVTDARGSNTVNVYDAADRLRKTTNGEGQVTVFDYDASGNRTSVTDGKGQTTTFQYDGLNRLVKTTDAAGVSEVLGYDAINRTARVDAMGRTTNYTYDRLNRLKKVLYSGAASDSITYEYYDDNQIKWVFQSGEGATVGYEYDVLGRLSKESSNGVSHTYTYDLAGNRTGVIYGGSERSLEVGFDGLNRIQSIEDEDRLTEYAYTLNGSEASRTFKINGSTKSKVTSTYDALNRLDVRTGFKGVSQIYSYDQGYDANGNVTSIVETYASGLSNRNLAMVYDDANRLSIENITVSGTTTSTGYEYDAADNCLEKGVTTGSNPTLTTTYAYNNLNQLTGATFSDNTPAITYGYDRNGNRQSRVQNANNTSYGYDFENRLTSLRSGGLAKTVDIFPIMGAVNGAPTQATYHLVAGDLHEYSYDYRTRRVKRVEAGVATTIVFSGGTSVAEMTGLATPEDPTVEYVRGPDMGGGVGGLLYSLRPETVGAVTITKPSFGHFNGRGDIVAKTDDTGEFSYQASYEARGTRTQEDGATFDRQRANTKEEDPTGLLNEGFRYRDLETGTFLTRDPAGFIDGPNLYAYVRQNPWTHFDPDGLLTLTDEERAKIKKNDGVSRSVIEKYGKGVEATTPKDILNDQLKSNGVTNAGWMPGTRKWDLRSQYGGGSDEDIALAESARRNFVKAQVALAQNGLLDKKDVQFLQVRGLLTMAHASAEIGLMLAPYGRLASALKPVAGVTEAASVNAVTRIGEASGTRQIAGYDIGGSTMMLNGTYKMNIWGMYDVGGQGLKAFATAVRGEASAAGASRIQIVGSHVINEQIANPAILQRAARMNGFNAQFSDGRVFLTAPVSLP